MGRIQDVVPLAENDRRHRQNHRALLCDPLVTHPPCRLLLPRVEGGPVCRQLALIQDVHSGIVGNAGADPYYALCSDLYRPGVEIDISLAGIGYLMAVLEAGQTVSHPEIGETHLDGAAVLLPIDDPPPEPLPVNGFGLAYIQSQPNGPGLDDYHFRAPVRRIESVDFLTLPAWRLTATVLRLNDGADDIDIALYVLDDKIREGQRPSIGTDVTGALWLQGTAFRGNE